jgi:hypothetical protein
VYADFVKIFSSYLDGKKHFVKIGTWGSVHIPYVLNFSRCDVLNTSTCFVRNNLETAVFCVICLCVAFCARRQMKVQKLKPTVLALFNTALSTFIS